MDEGTAKGFWYGVKRLIIEEDRAPDTGVRQSTEGAAGGEPAEPDQFALPQEARADQLTEIPFPLQTSGELDTAPIYAAAQIAAGPSSVEKAMALLKTLPKDTPLSTQQTIVRTTLQSFGVEVQALVEDAERKRQALAAYVAAGQKALEQFRNETNSKIAAFQAEIEQLRKDIQVRAEQQQNVAVQCRAIMDDMDRVGEFFKETMKEER